MQPVATEGNTESLCKAYPHGLWAAHEVQKGGEVSLAPAPRNWDTSSTERTALGHTAIAKTIELNMCVCVYIYTHLYMSAFLIFTCFSAVWELFGIQICVYLGIEYLNNRNVESVAAVLVLLIMYFL